MSTVDLTSAASLRNQPIYDKTPQPVADADAGLVELWIQQTRQGRSGYLGVNEYWQMLFAKIEESFFIDGDPRTGKSATELTPFGRLSPTTMFVLSTKEDLRDDLYAYRVLLAALFGGHVLEMNKDGRSLGRSIRWNPVQGCDDWNVALDRTDDLARLIFGETEGNGKHFSDRASQLYASYLHAAALVGDDINEVARVIASGKDQKYRRVLYEEYMAATNAKKAGKEAPLNRRGRFKCSDIPLISYHGVRGKGAAGENEMKSIISTTQRFNGEDLRTYLDTDAPSTELTDWKHALDYHRQYPLGDKSDLQLWDENGRKAPTDYLDIEDVVGSASTIFCIANDRSGKSGPRMSAFLSYCMDVRAKLADDHYEKRPNQVQPIGLVLLCDESTQKGARLDRLAELMAQAGGMGAQVVVVAQTIAMLEEAYGKAGVAAARMANQKVFFPNSDVEELERLSTLSPEVIHEHTHYVRTDWQPSEGDRFGEELSQTAHLRWEKSMLRAAREVERQWRQEQRDEQRRIQQETGETGPLPEPILTRSFDEYVAEVLLLRAREERYGDLIPGRQMADGSVYRQLVPKGFKNNARGLIDFLDTAVTTHTEYTVGPALTVPQMRQLPEGTTLQQNGTKVTIRHTPPLFWDTPAGRRFERFDKQVKDAVAVAKAGGNPLEVFREELTRMGFPLDADRLTNDFVYRGLTRPPVGGQRRMSSEQRAELREATEELLAAGR